MKKSLNFMKIVVVFTLILLPIAVPIFVVLQLKTGLDPSPYLTALTSAVSVELVLTSVLKNIDRWIDLKKTDEPDEKESDGDVG